MTTPPACGGVPPSRTSSPSSPACQPCTLYSTSSCATSATAVHMQVGSTVRTATIPAKAHTCDTTPTSDRTLSYLLERSRSRLMLISHTRQDLDQQMMWNLLSNYHEHDVFASSCKSCLSCKLASGLTTYNEDTMKTLSLHFPAHTQALASQKCRDIRNRPRSVVLDLQ